MQMLWCCGLGGVSMTTVTIAAQWPGRHLHSQWGKATSQVNYTHATHWRPSITQFTCCWAQACLQHKNYRGVPLINKLHTDTTNRRSSITHAPATHNLQSYSNSSYNILMCCPKSKFSAGHHPHCTHIPQSAGVQLAFSTIVICKLSWWKIDNII